MTTTTFKDFVKHDPSITNPQLFTNDFEDGKFVFYRGSHRISLKPEQVSRLIGCNDFYADVDKLLNLSRYTYDFANELANLLNANGLFVEVVQASYADGLTQVSFALDLPKLDLVPVDLNNRFPDYKNCDFMVNVRPYNINYQYIFDEATAEFYRAVGKPHLTPVLKYEPGE